MKPQLAERWQKIKDIFGDAIDVDPIGRAAYLDRACDGDQVLREEVELLLSAHDAPDGLAEFPAFDLALRAIWQYRADSLIGKRLGDYRVVDEIGSGGMGTVYLARRDDDAFRRDVAIKIVGVQGLDSEFIRQRLRSERDILARLDHPNIARLLDGGTTDDGNPYFVMEYIKGRSIIEYCNEEKLATTDRLTLFLGVCDAVHYAHQNLIVHRDIKSHNILVTADGVPKLLDFGIAKLLRLDGPTPTIERANTAQRLMTPIAASPEQIRGDPVSTASDVYSLGVLLYELLTGRYPYHPRIRSTHGLEIAICEDEPERPSQSIWREDTIPGREHPDGLNETAEDVSRYREGTPEKLARRLRGDLDTILLKTLRKEPGERYSSVEKLADDIRRHLDGFPVLARKGTVGYRAAKLFRRHAVTVAAAVLVLVAVFSIALVALRQRSIAEVERGRAEQRSRDVWQLAKGNIFELNAAIERLPGSTEARGVLVRQALAYLDSLTAEPTAGEGFGQELARAYLRVGEVQGRPYAANLGDISGALASFHKAERLLTDCQTRDAGSASIRRDLSLAYERIGEVLAYRMHDFPQARRYHDRALTLRFSLLGEAPEHPEYRFLVATSLIAIGDTENMRADGEGALESFRPAEAILERLTMEDPSNPDYQRNLAAVLQRKLYVLRTFGQIAGQWGYPESAEIRFRECLRLQERVQTIRESLPAGNVPNTRRSRSIADSRVDRAELLGWLREFTESRALFERVRDEFQALAAVDPDDAELRFDLVSLQNRYAAVLRLQGDTRTALSVQRATLSLAQQLAQTDRRNAEAEQALIQTHLAFADEALAVGERGTAFEHAHAVFPLIEASITVDRRHPRPGLMSALHAALHLFEKLGKTEDRNRCFQSLAAWVADHSLETAEALVEKADVRLCVECPALFDPHQSLILVSQAKKVHPNHNPNIESVRARAYLVLGDASAFEAAATRFLRGVLPEADFTGRDVITRYRAARTASTR